LADKDIGWTTRFNSFYNDDTRPAGYADFASDGEGIDIQDALA